LFCLPDPAVLPNYSQSLESNTWTKRGCFMDNIRWNKRGINRGINIQCKRALNVHFNSLSDDRAHVNRLPQSIQIGSKSVPKSTATKASPISAEESPLSFVLPTPNSPLSLILNHVGIHKKSTLSLRAHSKNTPKHNKPDAFHHSIGRECTRMPPSARNLVHHEAGAPVDCLQVIPHFVGIVAQMCGAPLAQLAVRIMA